MDDGAGLMAYFIRYSRMNVPLDTLTEGTAPTPVEPALEQVTVTLDQWGDSIKITDIAEIVAAHPLVQQAIKLLADNAARVIDREIQVVWLANTNVQYYDGSVAARSSLVTASSHYLTDNVIIQAVASMEDDGVNPRSGPFQEDAMEGEMSKGKFVGIAGPQVLGDIRQASTSVGTWTSTAMYNAAEKLYGGEVGEWQGVRWVKTNFIPKFTRYGNGTTAVASGAAFGTGTPVVTAVDGGGTLTSGATYYYKVTRKSKTRGFEEDISIEHTTAAAATANNESFTFAFTGLSSAYRYYIYFGSATGDSNLKQVSSAGHEADTTATVTAVSSSTVTAPANVDASTGPTVHPVYIVGAEACYLITLRALETYKVDKPDKTEPLGQFKILGYKFLQKAMITDSSRLLRLEVVSRFS
jgi:N4-gp56 family major capsid protein